MKRVYNNSLSEFREKSAKYRFLCAIKPEKMTQKSA
nr:MAG TPA: hypothetical protein [Caudoviricetes sp.]